MKTCKSGSEGVSVKPDVEIHQGARLLPYKGNVVGRRSEFVSLVDTQHHRCIERTYLILLLMRNTVNPISSVRGREP